jgi:hypothetical protein
MQCGRQIAVSIDLRTRHSPYAADAHGSGRGRTFAYAAAIPVWMQNCPGINPTMYSDRGSSNRVRRFPIDECFLVFWVPVDE